MELTRASLLNIKDKQLSLGEILDKLVYLSASSLANYLVKENKRFKRALRMKTIIEVIEEPVNLLLEEDDLNEKYNERLLWFNHFSDTQLVNCLHSLDNAALNKTYIEKLLYKISEYLVESDYEHLLKLLGEKANSRNLTNIKQYNKDLDVIFYDKRGEVDGLKIEKFRKVLFNSSSIAELKEIVTKYNLEAPTRIKKSELLSTIKLICQDRGMYTDALRSKLDNYSLDELKDYAVTNYINIPTEINKERIIEHILSNAEQTKNIYTIPLTEQVYEGEPSKEEKSSDDILDVEEDKLRGVISLPAKDVLAFFDSIGISMPRELRMEALKSVLKDVIKKELESNTIDDELRRRYLYYDKMSEVQLENTLVSFHNKVLELSYLRILFETIEVTMHAHKLKSELKKFIKLGEDYYAIHGFQPLDIKNYNKTINGMFYDRDKQIDGLSIKDFRAVLYNSSTIDEIIEIGLKYDVEVPENLKEHEYVNVILKKMQVEGIERETIYLRIKGLSISELEDYANFYNLNVSPKTRKERAIEYILNNASNIKNLYTLPRIEDYRLSYYDEDFDLMLENANTKQDLIISKDTIKKIPLNNKLEDNKAAAVENIKKEESSKNAYATPDKTTQLTEDKKRDTGSVLADKQVAKLSAISNTGTALAPQADLIDDKQSAPSQINPVVVGKLEKTHNKIQEIENIIVGTQQKLESLENKIEAKSLAPINSFKLADNKSFEKMANDNQGIEELPIKDKNADEQLTSAVEIINKAATIIKQAEDTILKSQRLLEKISLYDKNNQSDCYTFNFNKNENTEHNLPHKHSLNMDALSTQPAKVDKNHNKTVDMIMHEIDKIKHKCNDYDKKLSLNNNKSSKFKFINALLYLFMSVLIGGPILIVFYILLTFFLS